DRIAARRVAIDVAVDVFRRISGGDQPLAICWTTACDKNYQEQRNHDRLHRALHSRQTTQPCLQDNHSSLAATTPTRIVLYPNRQANASKKTKISVLLSQILRVTTPN